MRGITVMFIGAIIAPAGLWVYATYIGGTFDQGCRSVCLDGPATWTGWSFVSTLCAFMWITIWAFALEDSPM